jgi:Glycosyltransferase family 87
MLLTILPTIPLVSLPQQQAKQVWLAVGLMLLAAAIWILSRLSGLALVEVAVLAAPCRGALAENFLLGQYYIFLHAMEGAGGNGWRFRGHRGTRRRLTEGVCINESPAWDADSRAIVFTSDCSRGLGLPALYRVKLAKKADANR